MFSDGSVLGAIRKINKDFIQKRMLSVSKLCMGMCAGSMNKCMGMSRCDSVGILSVHTGKSYSISGWREWSSPWYPEEGRASPTECAGKDVSCLLEKGLVTVQFGDPAHLFLMLPSCSVHSSEKFEQTSVTAHSPPPRDQSLIPPKFTLMSQ